MALSKEWFIIENEKTDLENVLTFIENIPSNMKQIFDDDITNFQDIYLKDELQNKVTKQLFLSAFQEAKYELELSLRQRRVSFRIDSVIDNENNGESIIKQIGFSKDSLKLKAAVLNNLWKKIYDQALNFPNIIIDFANNKLVKLFRKFLEYLNSLLGSLVALIPGVEPMKEFKEIIESYLSIAEYE